MPLIDVVCYIMDMIRGGVMAVSMISCFRTYILSHDSIHQRLADTPTRADAVQFLPELVEVEGLCEVFNVRFSHLLLVWCAQLSASRSFAGRMHSCKHAVLF